MKALILLLLSLPCYCQLVQQVIANSGALPIDSTPTFSPGAGTYSTMQSVTISTITSGATLCYTTDGSTPTATVPGTCDGNTYSMALSVSTSQTIKAIATKLLTVNSAVGSAAYVISSLGATTNNTTLLDSGAQQKIVVTLGTTPTVGNTLLATIVNNTPSLTISGCTDNQSPPNTYRQIASATPATARNLYVWSGYVATAVGTFTVTCTPSTTYTPNRIVIGEYTGFTSTVTQDGSTTSAVNSGGATCSPGNISTSHAVDLIYGGTNTGGNTVTAGTNYAIPTGANGNNVASEYWVVSSTNNYNPIFNATGGGVQYCIGVALY